MGVNDPIAYRWPFEWTSENMTEKRPVVNPLIRALIEHDYAAMDDLYRKGARLKLANENTFEAVLFHVIGDYKTAEWLVNHGMYSNFDMKHNFNEDAFVGDCVAPDGYLWGLLAKAWALGAYDVMDLLASRGFNHLNICIGGEHSWYIDELICERDDVKGMRILRENGYRIRPWDPDDYKYKELSKKYPGCVVLRDIAAHPLVHRKSFGLDGFLFSPLDEPKKFSVRFFHRKEDQRRNELEQADYQDRLRAQQRYAKQYAAAGRIKTQQEQEKEDDEFNAALAAVTNRWKNG